MTIEEAEDLCAAAEVGFLRVEDRGRHAEAVLLLAARDRETKARLMSWDQ